MLSRRQEGGALTGELTLDRQLDGEAGEEKEVVVVLATSAPVRAEHTTFRVRAAQ